MKWTSFAAAAAIALTTASAAEAAPPRGSATDRLAVEKSPDLVARKPGVRRYESFAAPLAGPAAAAAPPVEDVGDADSFGKAVIYLGSAQTKQVSITDDCTGSDPATDVCILRPPGDGFVDISEPSLAVHKLPGKATKSLLCFAFTPILFVNYGNDTAASRLAQMQVFMDVKIENPVLDDPTLIDPTTGLPFNGEILTALTAYRETFTLAAGAIDHKRMSLSRHCIGGLLSKRALVEGYGFTEALANKFFRNPTTITLGASGAVRSADFFNLIYGVRFYGD
jgi:hypothetical protein